MLTHMSAKRSAATKLHLTVRLPRQQRPAEMPGHAASTFETVQYAVAWYQDKDHQVVGGRHVAASECSHVCHTLRGCALYSSLSP